MEVTVDGIVAVVKFSHPKKTPSGIAVTPSGMMTDESPTQYQKAYCPMAETVLGITVDIQPEIRVLVAVCMIALLLLRLSYTGLFPSTTIEAKL